MPELILFRQINRSYKYLRTTAVFIEVALKCCTFEKAAPLVMMRHTQERGGSRTLRKELVQAFRLTDGQQGVITC